MQCIECSAQNKDDARFCTRCGALLRLASSGSSTRKCPECRFENPLDGKYCAKCGADLREHADGHRKHEHDRFVQRRQNKKKHKRVDTKLHWHPAVVTVVLLVGVVLVIAGIELLRRNDVAPPARITESRSRDQKLESAAMQIASRFICSCGTCGEKPLDTCSCNRAIEERQFIRDYLEQGQSPTQVIMALNRSYGWIKPEFRAMVADSSLGTLAEPMGRTDKGKQDVSRKLSALATAGGVVDNPALLNPSRGTGAKDSLSQ